MMTAEYVMVEMLIKIVMVIASVMHLLMIVGYVQVEIQGMKQTAIKMYVEYVLVMVLSA